MRTRRLVIAHDAATRHQAARAWLDEHPRSEVLVLAPSRGAADDFLRAGCTDRGLFGVHRSTLAQLAGELAATRLAASGRTPLTRLGSEALAARAIELCRAAGDLHYFTPVADAPGLPRAVAQTLDELRHHRVDTEAIASHHVAQNAGRSAASGDLASLLERYLAEAESRGLIDRAGVYEVAASFADGDPPAGEHVLLGLPVLALDVAVSTPVERALLAAVAGRAPAVLATAQARDEEAIAALGAALGASAEAVDECHPGTRRLDLLRRRLFAVDLGRDRDGDRGDDIDDGTLTENKGRHDDDSVVVLTAAGEGRECVEIARRVLARAGAEGPGDGVRFDDMAILLRDPLIYLPLVEEALRRAEIPAYFSHGTVRPRPAGRALLALLACAAERLSASRFAEYLSLAQVPPLAEDGAPRLVEVPWTEPSGDQLVFKSLVPADEVDAEPAAEPSEDRLIETTDERSDDVGDTPAIAGSLRTPRRWERLLVDAAVVGGDASRWRRRLSGLGAELRLRLREVDDGEPAESARLRRQLRQLGRLERFALPVIEALVALPKRAKWGPWRIALESLASLTLRRPEPVLGVLAELRPMDDVGPVELDEVRRVLEERLSFLRLEPPPRRFGRVLVATVEEARGRSFDTVFLPGLAEGIFPRRRGEDPLLLDADRRELAAELPTRHARLRDERLLLRLAAGAARRRLILSYPNLDTLQGRSRVPSFYALDLLRAAEGELPDLRRLEEQAGETTAARLGWPAPRDPQLAIDDAEFDLATLEPLLRLPPDQVLGAGRYLLEANDALARTLRTRYARWRPSFSPADGLVAPSAEGAAVLSGERLDRRSYSPTALQSFAACPYRFLLYAIHRLRPRDRSEPLEQLDPLTRGSLFHEVQFELLTTLRDAELLPVTAARLDAVVEHADATLDRLAGRYADELAPAIPRVWRGEIEALRADLRGWLHSVAGAGETWRPAWFELSFGLGHQAGRDDGSRADPVVLADGRWVRGSIDLVEIDDARGVLRVTDHKTGKAYASPRLQVGRGETLQPVLYALAAEQLLERPVESGRLFFCTRRGDYADATVAIDDDARRALGDVLATIDSAVAEGFLPAAPRPDGCRWCDYRAVCGPLEEQRLAYKLAGLHRRGELPPEVERLERLRRMR